MNQPAKAQEPSMEEILASIRRIIADDDPNRSAAKPAEAVPPRPVVPPRPAAVVPPPPPPAPEPEPEPVIEMLAEPEPMPLPEPEPEPASDVLDLTEEMAAAAPHAAGFRTIDGEPDVVFDEGLSVSPGPALDPRQLRSDGPERPLISSTTSAAVDSAFNTLAHTVLVQNARTLEDLVKEMLRPMLKTWLDDNLPGLVERLVRAEIERVSRGRS
jgi:uncharacterized protein